MATPPSSPAQQSVPIPKEVREKTPEQPPKTVEEPSSATKKQPTPQSLSHGFLRIPSDLGSGPTGLEDFGDFFNDGKLKATKDKLKDVEAENVALRNEVEELTNEVEELTEKILDVEAQYKAMNETNKTLLEMHCHLQVSMASANEILKKDVEDLRADKAVKDEQIKMLYVVIENPLGINVHATSDEIEIQRAEAWRMEKEKRDVEVAAEALKDKRKGVVIVTEEILGSSSQQEQPQPDAEVSVSHVEVNTDDVEMKDAEVEVDATDIEYNLAIFPLPSFILVGKSKEVVYSEEVSLRRIEVERRRLNAKLKKLRLMTMMKN
ncbi:hypothetical protein HanPI659440_Chr05g0194881 [Helianthus annuus]|nr:hypothetical protein HanPI659440_Chr05g0194881 [Helianthus annuus]